MPRRFLPLFLCGAALIAPSTASAQGGSLHAARARAVHILHKAQAAIHGRGVKTGHELTPLLKELDVRMKYLTGTQKREATQLLARPTLGQAATGENGYTVPEHNPPYCSLHFCIHWVDTTDDAPSLADADGNGIPDYVETMDGVFEHVWDVENGQMGWRPPTPDGNVGGNENKTDVYIKQLGPSQIFGYSAPDPGQRTNSQTAYLVMDNDYRQSEYPRYSNPLPPMEVTAAHEYNHVLQFGYDVLQDTWLFESTAVWMEDKVYDDINDYLSYLTPWTQLGQVPLTRFNSTDSTDPYNVKVYGDAVFPRFVDEHYGQQTVRGVWEQSLSTTPPSFAPAAYDKSLRMHGAGGFFDVFTDFVAHLPEWRSAPDGFRDGGLFPDMQRVRTSLKVNGQGLSGALDHTSFALMNVLPTTTPRVKLFGGVPKGDQGAIALVGRTGDELTGTPTIVLKRLPKGGEGSVVLDNASSFARITVVLVNADASESGFSNQTGDWVFKRDGQQVFARVSTDFSPPRLRSRSAKRKGKSVVIKLQFTEAVGNVSTHTISLVGPGGHHVRAHVHYDSRSHRVTITPTRSLRGGTRYTVHIGSEIVDNGGNLLPNSQRQFSFTARR